MKFNNKNLHVLAEKYYFLEYLSLLKNRKIRLDLAFTNHLNGFTLPNKPLERNLRKWLENVNPNVNPIVKQNIENMLASGDFISDNDPNVENYVEALNLLKQFNFPNLDENTVRNLEENDFQNFISNNPRDILSSPSLEDQKEFIKLILN